MSTGTVFYIFDFPFHSTLSLSLPFAEDRRRPLVTSARVLRESVQRDGGDRKGAHTLGRRRGGACAAKDTAGRAIAAASA